MPQEIKVTAETRQECGSAAARKIRRAGAVPAIIASVNGESILLKLNAHDFERVLSQHANTQLLVTLAIAGGKSCPALLREIQRDGITGRVTHADFSEIDTTKKIHVQIQVVLSGEPEGVKTQGGVLQQQLRHIDVQCLPADVVENFTVNVSELKLGDDVTVKDLGLDETKYTLVTHAGAVIATVSAVTEETAAATEGDGSAPAQPELSVKKGKAEDAAGADAKAAKPAAKPAAKK